jgi:hypothetical protein|tara:strand:+ start:11128 stop:11289 length:162 start_codon:yes stop_codon:yes gene_type:complete
MAHTKRDDYSSYAISVNARKVKAVMQRANECGVVGVAMGDVASEVRDALERQP